MVSLSPMIEMDSRSFDETVQCSVYRCSVFECNAVQCSMPTRTLGPDSVRMLKQTRAAVYRLGS